MPSEPHECETCLEMGKSGVKANREYRGVWVCVDCIVSINAEDARKDRDRPHTDLLTQKVAVAEVFRPNTVNGVVEDKSITLTRNLAANLSSVMDKLLKGDIDATQALAACKVSTELLKAAELMWRMTK